jgi:hypothetical protein
VKLGAFPIRIRMVALSGPADAARLAITKLRELAGECAECGGSGQVAEKFELYLMTDDVRQAHQRRAVRISPPRLEPHPRGVVPVGKPCGACADIRQVVKLCEAAL